MPGSPLRPPSTRCRTVGDRRSRDRRRSRSRSGRCCRRSARSGTGTARCPSPLSRATPASPRRVPASSDRMPDGGSAAEIVNRPIWGMNEAGKYAATMAQPVPAGNTASHPTTNPIRFSTAATPSPMVSCSTPRPGATCRPPGEAHQGEADERHTEDDCDDPEAGTAVGGEHALVAALALRPRGDQHEQQVQRGQQQVGQFENALEVHIPSSRSPPR